MQETTGNYLRTLNTVKGYLGAQGIAGTEIASLAAKIAPKVLDIIHAKQINDMTMLERSFNYLDNALSIYNSNSFALLNYISENTKDEYKAIFDQAVSDSYYRIIGNIEASNMSDAEKAKFSSEMFDKMNDANKNKEMHKTARFGMGAIVGMGTVALGTTLVNVSKKRTVQKGIGNILANFLKQLPNFFRK